MSLLIADFRTNFPEFADSTAWPDTLVGVRLQQAYNRISPSFFGKRVDDAQGYLTAHLLLVTAPGRSAGATDIQAGTARVSYSVGHGLLHLEALNSTLYGREFALLRRMSGGPQVVV